MTDQPPYQPPTYQPVSTYPQAPAAAPMTPAPLPVDEDPHQNTRRLLLLALVFIIVIGLGAVFGRLLLRGGSPGPEKGEGSRSDLGGRMMGIFLRNGTAYFGTAVYEDDKTILLRDIFISLGFFPLREGGSPVLQVAKLNEYNPDAPREKVYEKEEILFYSDQVSPEIVEAIERYVPPTSTPVPVATPEPEGKGTSTLTPSPVPTLTPGTPLPIGPDLGSEAETEGKTRSHFRLPAEGE